MGGRCAGSIPFVQNLNFRPLPWSRYNPSYLFYKTGLQEFLAACGVRGTSANTPLQNGVIAEGGAEGPRCIRKDQIVVVHSSVRWGQIVVIALERPEGPERRSGI